MTKPRDLAKLGGGFIQSGAGAVQRTVVSKLKDTVSVKDFGAVGDGVANDTAAIQAAIDSLGAGGGIVNAVGKFYVANNLIVKPNVFLVGQLKVAGRSTVGSGAATDYSAISCGSIRLASTATVELRGGAGLEGLLIYRFGMSFPATSSTTSTAFAGTAVTVTGDDASVRSCMIMGFNKAIYSDGAARLRVDALNHDNINGIEITDCNDIPYLTNCHAWPFATIVAGQIWQNLIRAGRAYYIHDFVDWAKFTNCFSYGYSVGFEVSNANSAVFTACGADNVFDGNPLYAGSIGFVINNVCYDTKLLGCQAAAQATSGIFINTFGSPDRLTTLAADCTIWGRSTHGILVNSGDALISGGLIRDVNYAISVVAANSKVVINGTFSNNISNKIVNAAASTNNIYYNGFTDFAGSPVSATVVAPSVASADPLNLTNDGEVFTITGTTSFGSLNHGWLGRKVTLIFSDALTVFSSLGGVSSIKLLSGANFTAGLNSALHLIHNGSQWYEIGRS